jgi:glycine/D-amino acid oxidase-like deaminating enzyme
MQVDFLIIGQGLAGSLLAKELLQRGRSVCVVDDGWKSAASQVAAGLMTPLTGRRFTLTRGYPALFATAQSKLGGLGVFRAASVYRMFVDQEQRLRGLGRADDASCAPFVERLTHVQGQLDESLTDEFGGCQMRGAWVDLPMLLSQTKATLLAAGAYRTELFAPEEVAVLPAKVVWKDVAAGALVYCDGYKSSQRGPFTYLPWQPAKGEALTLASDAPQRPFVLNRDGWALPLGGGRWRTGTNWAWDELNETPTEAQRTKLLARFSGYFRHPVCSEVLAHVAGVRPCTADNHPFMGTHPSQGRVHLFNGLGPRGSVWAPAMAAEMAAYLCDGTPLRKECNLARFEV